MKAEHAGLLPEEAYNATVTWLRRVHEELLILRVRPDAGRLDYVPGQYTLLGLRASEPHLECDEPPAAPGDDTLIRRAYSITCTPCDSTGRLVRQQAVDELEFYITLVRKSEHLRPKLTPRLFALDVGSRLYVAPRALGHYTLEGMPPNADVLFCATGTGEAPHNPMIAELLSQGHRGRIASIVCVRQRRDLAYQSAHQQLMRQFHNYRYVPLTTREPENLDITHPHYVGKQYVQDLFQSPDFTQRTGLEIDPDRLHVFLCGLPQMIGSPGGAVAGRGSGMLPLLLARGFQIDQPHAPGNVHMERYA